MGAVTQTEAWIERYRPHVVVTEDPSSRGSKGVNTHRILEAITSVAERADLIDVFVSRRFGHENKYDEAISLGKRFPVISAWAPAKRRIWEAEPRGTVIFEALGLAVQVVDEFSCPP